MVGKLIRHHPTFHQQIYVFFVSPHLISMQNLKEGFVDVWLALEAVLDLIDVVDGMVELHRLVVLQGRGTCWCAADWRVGLDRGGARRCVGRDGRVGLTGRGQGWRLHGLWENIQLRHFLMAHKTVKL